MGGGFWFFLGGRVYIDFILWKLYIDRIRLGLFIGYLFVFSCMKMFICVLILKVFLIILYVLLYFMSKKVVEVDFKIYIVLFLIL